MATTSLLTPRSATTFPCGCVHIWDASGTAVDGVKCGTHTIVPSEALAAFRALTAKDQAELEGWEERLLATIR